MTQLVDVCDASPQWLPLRCRLDLDSDEILKIVNTTFVIIRLRHWSEFQQVESVGAPVATLFEPNCTWQRPVGFRDHPFALPRSMEVERQQSQGDPRVIEQIMHEHVLFFTCSPARRRTRRRQVASRGKAELVRADVRARYASLRACAVAAACARAREGVRRSLRSSPVKLLRDASAAKESRECCAAAQGILRD